MEILLILAVVLLLGIVAALWYVQNQEQGQEPSIMDDAPTLDPGLDGINIPDFPPPPPQPRQLLLGANIDINNPDGKPTPAELEGMNIVRLLYDVSHDTGNTDIDAAFARYHPYVKSLHKAGLQILFTTTHETYGEGRNEYWDIENNRWMAPDDERWEDLSDKFAEMMGRIAQQWHEAGIPVIWQCWNEPDSQAGHASVPVSAENYGYMLGKFVKAVKGVDRDIQVIAAGLNSGPDSGTQFIRTALTKSGGHSPDGIAFHPYGRATEAGEPYGQFGDIFESMEKYTAVLPDQPVWISEWGVLGRPSDNVEDIAGYADAMISQLGSRYRRKIAAMVWYPWSDAMDTASKPYGLVDKTGTRKQRLMSIFTGTPPPDDVM